MAEEKKKEEKGKEKIMGEKEKKEEKKDNEVITAIYKVNLHCHECGRKIKKHLLITQGVQSVDIDIEKGEIKAKGKLEPLKILKLIEKKSKKKVELISPKIKLKDTPHPPKDNPKEIKQPIIRTMTVKVHMHCDKCERDLHNRLLKHKGIFNVKTDQKAELVTIEGSIEAEKLLRFLKRKVHKNAEIISSKELEEENKNKKKKSEDDKEIINKEKKKEEAKSSSSSTKEEAKNELGKSSNEKEKEKEKKDEKGISESSSKEKENYKVIEIGRDTKLEIVMKDNNVPYIIHYVYAPQIFSDENPNACCIF